jgi:hypothetical protein
MAARENPGTSLKWRPGTRPSLNQIRKWPATVSVEEGALALGSSKSTAYQAIAAGEFPVATIRVRRRLRVLTADLIRVLEGEAARSA